MQGDSEPEISTDRPEVVRLGRVNTCTGGEHWYEHGFFADSSIVGAGDANIYVKLNGEIVAVYTIHAENQNAAAGPEETETQEQP